MKKISIYKPSTVDEAIQILSQHGTSASVYAGGTDLLIRLKNRLEQAPTYLVDIKKIDHLRYIKEDAQGGVEIGAATKLAELADSRVLQEKYPMLVEAVNKISSPELRNRIDFSPTPHPQDGTSPGRWRFAITSFLLSGISYESPSARARRVRRSC